MVKAVLFDLDGTLLPMDNDTFTKGYFKHLAAKLAPHGYEAKPLIDAIWTGTAAMVMNDGSRTNYDTFWAKFAEVLGERVYNDQWVFEEFYAKDFNVAKQYCGFRERSGEGVKELKKQGFRVALASNPLFPMEAQLNRIRWAGLDPGDFEFITSYEESVYCKPNLDYYRDAVNRLGLSPEECVMVGNDVDEDMVAEKLEMKVFLLTDDLINKHSKPVENYPRGDFEQALEYIISLKSDT